jgi:hypothetical protein
MTVIYTAGTTWLIAAAERSHRKETRLRFLEQSDKCVEYLKETGTYWETGARLEQLLRGLVETQRENLGVDSLDTQEGDREDTPEEFQSALTDASTPNTPVDTGNDTNGSSNASQEVFAFDDPSVDFVDLSTPARETSPDPVNAVQTAVGFDDIFADLLKPLTPPEEAFIHAEQGVLNIGLFTEQDFIMTDPNTYHQLDPFDSSFSGAPSFGMQPALNSYHSSDQAYLTPSSYQHLIQPQFLNHNAPLTMPWSSYGATPPDAEAALMGEIWAARGFQDATAALKGTMGHSEMSMPAGNTFPLAPSAHLPNSFSYHNRNEGGSFM